MGAFEPAKTFERRAEVEPVGPPSSLASAIVSVIVPVRNNPDGVRTVLACLAAQTLPPERFEVIVGDDGSAPALRPQLDGAGERVRVIRQPPRTSYAARNAAAAAATGNVFAFCDSDCLPQPTWLEEALAALEVADIVDGEVTFTRPTKPNVWSLLTIDMFLDQHRNACLQRGVTANLVVRRSLFERLGGFDESLASGGDYDLVRRASALGARLRYAPQAVVHHPTIDASGPFLRKVWNTNFYDGMRRARDRESIDPIGALILLPIVGPLLARRQAMRPLLHLHRPRLRASSIEATWRDDAWALTLLYSVVSYVAGAARAYGWILGRRAPAKKT